MIDVYIVKTYKSSANRTDDRDAGGKGGQAWANYFHNVFLFINRSEIDEGSNDPDRSDAVSVADSESPEGVTQRGERPKPDGKGKNEKRRE